ncbi:MAG: hypothetical protein BGO01_02165 [Armatimonadetes bacterium 55-13]|nr:hypothetical protein [Armatimonadota bacterium]OJU65734.1 MAG: hypothetical protein BGO01_02165 [Armatimonadetes bacterium 55-13]
MKRRASALLYVLMMTLATSAIVMATINLAASGHNAEVRDERKAMAGAAFDGMVDQVLSDSAAGVLTVPSTRPIALDPVGGSVTVTDNGGAVAGSYLVEGTMTVGGLTYRQSRIIGRKGTPNPFFYVLFSNSSLSSTQAVVTNGPSWAGDVSINGNLTLSNPSTQINGDVEATGAINPATLSVTGSKLQGVSAVPFTKLPYILIPALNPYLIEAILQLPGLLIDGLNLGSGYPLAYALLATQIKGTFTGKGTIYFPGDVTVVGDMFYGDSNSRIAIIAYGNITVAGSVTHLVGHLYAGGTITFQASSAKLLDTGSVVANAVSIQAPVTLNHDPAIWQDPSEGYRLKLPGYWP